MASLTTLTINDRESTPVAHNFVPFDRKNGVAILREADSVSPLGDKYISLSTRTTGAKKRSRILVAVPIISVETINAVDRPRLERTIYVEVLMTSDVSSTAQERDNAVAFAAGCLADGAAMCDDLLVNNNPVTG